MREIIKGKIQGNARGYGFLITEDGKEDYFIPHSDLRGAMHGDTVICEPTDGTGERTTARVLKVIERGIKEVVGTYFSNRHGGYVVPDDGKYFTDINIRFGKGIRAKAGDKVVCKILAYGKGNPEGMICKIFGRQFTKEAELKSILFTYKLPEKFKKSVIDEAEGLPKTVLPEQLLDREDYRNLITMTIDGDDSRDFDDAVSIEKTKDGYILGVHIADVSEYVKESSELDVSAFNRATSVYFPESVIPMLPERLSCDLCSLVEGKDRLTLSCILYFDESGNLKDKKIVKSVIKSRARLTYSVVQKIIENEKQDKVTDTEVLNSLNIMYKLAKILQAKREEKGSIDLEVNESAITVDKKTGEISVEPARQDDAHKIIEEFMIATNCAVAEYMYFLDCPFIYRVHGKPTEERVENFYAFLNGLGITPKRRKDEIFSKDFQLILKNAEDTPQYTVINRVMLRSMQKAKYSPEESGHFGLSEKYYCHFTSPIRRYPDLAIHRIIKDFLAGNYEKLEQKYGEFVINASEQSSEQERISMEAERAVDDYYKLLYIENYEGEEFDGYISGVMNFGIFVELENGIEGLVRVETIKGGKFVLDKKSYTLTDGKTSYKLGEKARIKVVGVNIIDKRAEFMLVNLAKNKKK